jgi:hypothetical protein
LFFSEVLVRRLCCSFVVLAGALCALPPLAARAGTPVLPPVVTTAQRSNDIARLFQQFCLADEPSFDSLQAKAMVMDGARAVDHTEKLGENRQMRQRAWLVLRPSGTYQITAVEGMGATRAVGCEVTAPEGDGADLAQTMALEIGLGAPFKRVAAIGNRGNSVVWNTHFGAHQGKILLSYGAQGAAGASLHLILPNLPK